MLSKTSFFQRLSNLVDFNFISYVFQISPNEHKVILSAKGKLYASQPSESDAREFIVREFKDYLGAWENKPHSVIIKLKEHETQKQIHR